MARELEISIERSRIPIDVDFSEPNKYESILSDLSGVFEGFHEVLLDILQENVSGKDARVLAEGLKGKLEIFDINGILVESTTFQKPSLAAYSRSTNGLELALVETHPMSFPDQCLIQINVEEGAPKLKHLSQRLVIARRLDPMFLGKLRLFKISRIGMAVLGLLLMASVFLHLLYFFRRRGNTSRVSKIDG